MRRRCERPCGRSPSPTSTTSRSCSRRWEPARPRSRSCPSRASPRRSCTRACARRTRAWARGRRRRHRQELTAVSRSTEPGSTARAPARCSRRDSSRQRRQPPGGPPSSERPEESGGSHRRRRRRDRRLPQVLDRKDDPARARARALRSPEEEGLGLDDDPAHVPHRPRPGRRAGAFCTVRGVRMWRQLKRTGRTMGAELDTARGASRTHRDPARAGRDPERRARGCAGAATCLPRAAPGAARRARVSAGAHPLASSLPSHLTRMTARRGDRPRDELDPAPRRRRRRRPARRGRPPADDHAAGRRSRRAPAPPSRSHHARSQLPHGVSPRARGARGRAHARDRDERGARRGERRGVPRGDRMELRLHDAAALRNGRGGDDDPRRHGRAAIHSTTCSSSTSAAARPSSWWRQTARSPRRRASTSAACA